MRALESLKKFAMEALRVIRVTKKPSAEEFKTIVKISALGIALIGLIGFGLQVIKQLLFTL